MIEDLLLPSSFISLGIFLGRSGVLTTMKEYCTTTSECRKKDLTKILTSGITYIPRKKTWYPVGPTVDKP